MYPKIFILKNKLALATLNCTAFKHYKQKQYSYLSNIDIIIAQLL